MCRAEAPGVEQFAREHADRLDVIGLGTQDDLERARDFVSDGGITFPMLWDESFASWQALGLRSQPAAALFGADGDVLGAWMGPFDEDEVVELIDT
ncbi:MAG: TlpA family protein disulfide reductase [Acidimicrobiia bacterium]|nr:TlpA family protein disulfide reductase [Acidimicrobiia bacterium]